MLEILAPFAGEAQENSVPPCSHRLTDTPKLYHADPGHRLGLCPHFPPSMSIHCWGCLCLEPQPPKH